MFVNVFISVTSFAEYVLGPWAVRSDGPEPSGAYTDGQHDVPGVSSATTPLRFEFTDVFAHEPDKSFHRNLFQANHPSKEVWSYLTKASRGTWESLAGGCSTEMTVTGEGMRGLNVHL
jgi:hypothetical protein